MKTIFPICCVLLLSVPSFGDRSAAAHVFTLSDIQARFADVVSLEAALEYLERS